VDLFTPSAERALMDLASPDFREDLIAALPALRRFALVLTRNDVDAGDLLQETCERALSRWTQFEVGTRMESWLFSIMHSVWKNLARGRATEQRAHLELAHGTRHSDGERIATGKIAVSEVLSCLQKLDPDQAAALTLVALDGLSYREAATVLDVPQGTLESRIARGRIALGRLVDRTGSTPRVKARETDYPRAVTIGAVEEGAQP